MKLFLQFAGALALCWLAAACSKDSFLNEDRLTDSTTLSSTLGVSERGDTIRTPIAFKDLPEAARKFLLKKDTSDIEKILKITLPNGTVFYSVHFEDHHPLRFDAAGKLIGDRHHDGGKGDKGDKGDKGGPHPGTKIGFKDLPAAAKTYLLTNADTSKIRHIVKITLPNGKTGYVIMIEGGKTLHFDADGKLIAAPVTKPTLTNVKVTDLPAAAQKTLKDKNLLDKVEKVTKVTLPDGKVFYTVDVKGGRTLFLMPRASR